MLAADAKTRIEKGASEPFETHTLQDFIRRADDPSICENILDSYMPYMEVPYWLSYIAFTAYLLIH